MHIIIIITILTLKIIFDDFVIVRIINIIILNFLIIVHGN